MKTKTRVFFTLWITIAQSFCLAQSPTQLKGQIVTPDQKPVDGAAVSLVLAADALKVAYRHWQDMKILLSPLIKAA